MFRRLIPAAVAAASLTGALVLTTPPAAQASANAACTPTSCGYVGQSPVSTGCANGAYAVANYHVLFNSGYAGAVNLMYSPGCNTNWTEADGYGMPTDIIVWNTKQQQEKKDNLTNYGGYGYTTMVNGSYDAGACIENDRFMYCIGQPAIDTHPPYGF